MLEPINTNFDLVAWMQKMGETPSSIITTIIALGGVLIASLRLVVPWICRKFSKNRSRVEARIVNKGKHYYLRLSNLGESAITDVSVKLGSTSTIFLNPDCFPISRIDSRANYDIRLLLLDGYDPVFSFVLEWKDSHKHTQQLKMTRSI